MAAAKPPILWSPEALADLDQIWEYYAGAAGPAVADNILRAIDKVVSVISDYPWSGRARDDVRPGLRSLAVAPHVVFYRLREQPEIVRVLDGRRDVDEIFAEPPISPPE